MRLIFEQEFRVDSREVDGQNQCRPSALLGYLQEIATLHALELHVSREEMLERYNVFWMLARIWYRMERPLSWDERVTIRTWHRGGKGAVMYRDFDLLSGGKLIGEAVSSWVLADLETRKLFRLSKASELEHTDGGALCKKIHLNRLKMPGELTLAEERVIHYSDADINGHVNNTRYADFACDALHMERRPEGAFVSSMQLSYLKECRPGESLLMRVGHAEDQCFVQGDGTEGAARFDAMLTFGQV